MNAPERFDILELECPSASKVSLYSACNNDRDHVALQTGRILQSCSLVENALFRLVAERKDISGFTKIERSKAPAFRNLIAKVIAVLDEEISGKTKTFKNPKAFRDKLTEFDTAASLRSNLAHSEFIGVSLVNEMKVAILSNEGIAGVLCGDRRIQLISFDELGRLSLRAHQVANSLRQVIQNQMTPPLKTEATPPPSQPQPLPPAAGGP